MNPIKLLERQLYDERNHAGARNLVTVDAHALHEILRMHERDSSLSRVKHNDENTPPIQRLHDVVESIVSDGMSTEDVCIHFMKAVTPLVVKRKHEDAIIGKEKREVEKAQGSYKSLAPQYFARGI